MDSLIDIEDPKQHKYYEEKEQAVHYLRQQDSPTRQVVECPGMGH